MDDITIIMMTPNRVPKHWAKYHKGKLLKAIGDTPIITISKEPLDWGINLSQAGEKYGYPNLYKQMLRGAKLATTHWIGIADDDTLYPKQHFQFRPPEDGFYYNLNRWSLPTWGKNKREMRYFHKPRPGNGCMIATRELVIKAMETRIKACPELIKYFTKELGASRRMRKYDEFEAKSFYTSEPILTLVHDLSADVDAQKHQKYIWPVRAYDIPEWGKAEDIIKKFI